VIETSVSQGGSPVFEFVGPNTVMLGNGDTLNIYTIVTALSLGTPEGLEKPQERTRDTPSKVALQGSVGASSSDESSGSASDRRPRCQHSPPAPSSAKRTESCGDLVVALTLDSGEDWRCPTAASPDHESGGELNGLGESDGLVAAVKEVLPEAPKTDTWPKLEWVEGTDGRTEEYEGKDLVDTPSTGARHPSRQRQARGDALRDPPSIKSDYEADKLRGYPAQVLGWSCKEADKWDLPDSPQSGTNVASTWQRVGGVGVWRARRGTAEWDLPDRPSKRINEACERQSTGRKAADRERQRGDLPDRLHTPGARYQRWSGVRAVANESDKWDLPASPKDAGRRQNGGGRSCGWQKVVRGGSREEDSVSSAWRTRRQVAVVEGSSVLIGRLGGDHDGHDDSNGPWQRDEISGPAFCCCKLRFCQYLPFLPLLVSFFLANH
jgi:hypothetical protein